MVSKNKDKEVLYCSFNQDQSCFAVGTQTGFKIFSTAPLKETITRDLKGGIKIVEMLYKCNILALVGGGDYPKYPQNKVVIWDDHQSKAVAELSFKSDIKLVKLKAEKIIVSLEDRIYVYHFTDMKLIDLIETCKNPDGIFSVNCDPKGTLLACPAKTVGHVAIHPYDMGQGIVFRAHQSHLECMELNFSGTKIATASEKGTIIRVFNVSDGTKIHELRRGSDNAQIFSLAFDLESKWLACSSDALTIHVFSLNGTKKSDHKGDEENGDVIAKNPKSKLSFMKKINRYFGSEWSVAQFKVYEKKTKVVFGQETNSLYIVGYDGNFYIVNFDPSNGGECLKQFEGRYI